MKQLQKSDLKEGEIYKANSTHGSYIFKATNNLKNIINVTSYKMFFKEGNFNVNNSNTIFSKATSEEKHWLETCIKANQFVSYEEAMETFIPEYVECINPRSWEQTIKENGGNLIFKSNFKSTCNNQIKDVYNSNLIHFKPSTKEAYDAQFVAKEPEFVLPKRWAIIITNENKDIVNNYRKSIFNNANISCNLDVNNVHLSDRYDGTYYHYNKYYFKEHTRCEEITFDQFKQYVLKENTTVIEESKIVLEEPKDKVLTTLQGKILEVESSEGGIFKIDDKIKVFGGSKNSILKSRNYLTIIGFRWNSNKTSICAITELYGTNGIGLDKIELYIEPKVKVKQELSLLEQAKLKYPIGTKFIPLNTNIVCEITTSLFNKENNYSLWEINSNGYNIHSNGACHYIYNVVNNRWAEIVDDFVLPENWYIKVTDDNKEVLQQYIRNVHNSTTITLSNINYVAYSKRLYGINRTENKLGYGLISKLNLNPLPNIYRTVTYYNGEEITFEQFKKYVLKDE